MEDIVVRLNREAMREKHEPIWLDAIREITELRRALSEKEKDAQRYQYIRAGHLYVEPEWNDGATKLIEIYVGADSEDIKPGYIDANKLEELDALIDLEIEKLKS